MQVLTTALSLPAQVGNDGVLRLWALDTALAAGVPRLACRCADDDF
jgi:hypothetical protein